VLTAFGLVVDRLMEQKAEERNYRTASTALMRTYLPCPIRGWWSRCCAAHGLTDSVHAGMWLLVSDLQRRQADARSGQTSVDYEDAAQEAIAALWTTHQPHTTETRLEVAEDGTAVFDVPLVRPVCWAFETRHWYGALCGCCVLGLSPRDSSFRSGDHLRVVWP
jgi:hypothetical protein